MQIQLLDREYDSRPIYFAELVDGDEWPPVLSPNLGRFVALITLDARTVSEDGLRSFAAALMRQGCLEAVAWGPGADETHQVLDSVRPSRTEMAVKPPAPDMYTAAASRSDEPIEEALWYSLMCAGDVDIETHPTLLVISQPTWRDELLALLADPDAFVRAQVDASS